MNPIRILITDTHLSESTIELNKSIFQQAFNVCLENRLNTLIHLGDVFQSRKSQSQLVLTTYREILDEAADKGIIISQVVGNHDKTTYNSADSFLDPFIRHPALRLYRYCGAEFIETENGRIGIHYASYFDDEKYIEMLREKNEVGGYGDKNVLLTHIGCTGTVMNNGARLENSINSKLFEKYDKVLIGHYHDLQHSHHIEYIGAAMQHSFGETSVKGATILYDDLSTALVPFKFPEYVTYEVDIENVTSKDIDDLKQEKSNIDGHLRVILKGDKTQLQAFNRQQLETAGIKVLLKQDEIIKEEVEARVEPFNNRTLKEEFKVFCTKNKLDYQKGVLYFDKIAENV